MNWNEFAADVHQVAVDHGWWEKAPSFVDVIVMCHTELSEAVEAYRKGCPMVYCEARETNAACEDPGCAGIDCLKEFPGRKPEGVAVEMADCILRILDWSAASGVDIDAVIGFTPSYYDVIRTIARCHYLISQAYVQTTVLVGSAPTANSRLLMCLESIMDWASTHDVDMEAILRAKHEYNKTRPYRHGGKAL